MTRRQIAENYFYEGYNCAQSVVLTFIDKLNINKETALKLASPFGGGMGRLREVCGAVSGMFLVLGALKGYSDATAKTEKTELYSTVQALAKKFEDKNGSIICRELISVTEKTSSPTPETRTQEYYKKRPCKLLVGDAAEIIENFILENNL